MERDGDNRIWISKGSIWLECVCTGINGMSSVVDNRIKKKWKKWVKMVLKWKFKKISFWNCRWIQWWRTNSIEDKLVKTIRLRNLKKFFNCLFEFVEYNNFNSYVINNNELIHCKLADELRKAYRFRRIFNGPNEPTRLLPRYTFRPVLLERERKIALHLTRWKEKNGTYKFFILTLSL